MKDTLKLWRVPGEMIPPVPYEVVNLTAFCREYDLDEQSMRNMLRGKVKQHKGWVAVDPDPRATKYMEIRTAEMEQMMAGTFEGDPSTEAWFKRAKAMGLVDENDDGLPL
jgi:hypothetical protein